MADAGAAPGLPRLSAFAGTLLLAGSGKMGGALLEGWLANGLPPDRVLIQDPAPPAEMADFIARHDLRCAASFTPQDAAPDVTILAVKPQIMNAVLPSIAPLLEPGRLVLSVAAGSTLESLARGLGDGLALVRVMPNTPASVGRGISGLYASAATTLEQRDLCEALMSAVGQTVWVASEDEIDLVTAVSGSGPAYVFHLVEALADAAEQAGLGTGTAMQLARATVSGAGELLHQSDLPASTLRENVTSPGGTTAAALDVLMAEPGLSDLMTRAVAAAADRARELR